MNAAQTILHIADPLHYGTIGGIWTKIIWFVFGLLLSGMSLSGFIMWYLRVNKLKKPQTRNATSPIQEA